MPTRRPTTRRSATSVLVNGRYAPYLDVSATRYRLRLLNSSPFSSYNFTLSDGRPFLQIGTGSGLLPRAGRAAAACCSGRRSART